LAASSHNKRTLFEFLMPNGRASIHVAAISANQRRQVSQEHCAVQQRNHPQHVPVRRPLQGARTGTDKLRKISDTIARLTALQAASSLRSGQTTNDGRLTPLSGFGSNPGNLAARSYLPPELPEGAPLVVVLHGCTQTAAGYDHHSGWSQMADEAGFALLYPEQQRANNQNLCFNWFQPSDVARGSGEALSIREMIETMVVAHKLDRKRIFITGLSAGGAMAAAMLAVYPDVFSAGAIIAGLPYGCAATIPEAFDRMRGQGGPSERGLQQLLRSASRHDGTWPRLSIWHGASDKTVASSNAKAIASQWFGVHEMGSDPSYSGAQGRRTREVWSSPSGDALIEINLIAGMGHGTPLGNDGLGTPGPFMLDVGVSSTREIARSWDIAGLEGTRNAAAPASGDRRDPDGAILVKSNDGNLKHGPRLRLGEPQERGSDPIGRVIEDALRRAGLMR
jgi:poly(hydroxyalkanoate) depolymerase family esterase